jgi:RNase H-fold protein (predicted Holliday junction resolvase)
MLPLEIIGLDVGERNTGIARGNSLAKLAEPLKSVKTADVLDELQKMAEKKRVNEVVIGLPRNLEGKDTRQTAWNNQQATSNKQKLMNIAWQPQSSCRTSWIVLKPRGSRYEI